MIVECYNKTSTGTVYSFKEGKYVFKEIQHQVEKDLGIELSHISGFDTSEFGLMFWLNEYSIVVRILPKGQDSLHLDPRNPDSNHIRQGKIYDEYNESHGYHPDSETPLGTIRAPEYTIHLFAGIFLYEGRDTESCGSYERALSDDLNRKTRGGEVKQENLGYRPYAQNSKGQWRPYKRSTLTRKNIKPSLLDTTAWHRPESYENFAETGTLDKLIESCTPLNPLREAFFRGYCNSDMSKFWNLAKTMKDQGWLIDG